MSTVKLQQARANAEKTKTYFDCMYETVGTILERARRHFAPIPESRRKSAKKAVIVITSNRGLAGGYNSNIVKLVTREEAFHKEELKVYAIGGKGRDALERAGYEIIEDLFPYHQRILPMQDAMALICKAS